MPFDFYDAPGQPATPGQPAGGGRPFISVHFECCGVFARIYRQPHQRFYQGRCPKCLRPIRVRVGREGTNTRLFRAW